MPLTLRSKPHRYVQVVAMGAKVVHARRVSNQGSTMCGEPIGPRHRATQPKKGVTCDRCMHAIRQEAS
jgi:hypothetical protein